MAIDKNSLPQSALACQATSAAVLRRGGGDPSAWQGLWMALLAAHAVVAHVSAWGRWLGPEFVAAGMHATALTTLLHPHSTPPQVWLDLGGLNANFFYLLNLLWALVGLRHLTACCGALQLRLREPREISQ